MDSEYDRVRAIRDKQFLYLRNYMPDKPYYQNIAFRLQQPMMPVILQMKNEGKLNADQMYWFRDHKPIEELYDCDADPFQLKNLADDPTYKEKLQELRKGYDEWISQKGDLSETEEAKMVKTWWGGKDEPPSTDTPKIHNLNRTIRLSCATPGSSIGYKFKSSDNWKVYKDALSVKAQDSMYVVAQRIGYKKSKVVSFQLKK